MRPPITIGVCYQLHTHTACSRCNFLEDNLAKPYVITLRVEEIALGATLRKLHEMPGVMSVDMDLGDKGGTGPGAKQLQEAAAVRSGTVSERIARFLAEKGPSHRQAIQAALGATSSTISSTLHVMKTNGIIERVAASTYALAKGVALPPLALPAPTKATTPSGRVASGAAQASMLNLLAAQPTGSMPRSTIAKELVAAGIPAKSFHGTLDRAEGAKLIKRTGPRENRIVTITDKGRAQIATSLTANNNHQMNGSAHHG